MNSVILGAIAMASMVAALFFLRFWRDTRDRFFLLFAIAFGGIEGLNRALLGLTAVSQEQEPFFYLVRLFTFGLILVAIVDKNRTKGARN
jgi:MFS-type transporter involved in bile tolerance (Atg22 family)